MEATDTFWQQSVYYMVTFEAHHWISGLLSSLILHGQTVLSLLAPVVELAQKVLVLQLATLRMSPVETLANFAFEVAAPHVEWAEKTSVSIQADFVTFFSQ